MLMNRFNRVNFLKYFYLATISTINHNTVQYQPHLLYCIEDEYQRCDDPITRYNILQPDSVTKF